MEDIIILYFIKNHSDLGGKSMYIVCNQNSIYVVSLYMAIDGESSCGW
mgnify:CR=1 FL=1